ncbi:unnamed protein product [Phytophthora lilii]|uniref:RxLR effector protein n=1 Tax=Phytophthora lilii TaxID=2077276 RepID=A0A9W7D7P3_9STRA|nr:unnamed protein product [Phytophthora lilii]
MRPHYVLLVALATLLASTNFAVANSLQQLSKMPSPPTAGMLATVQEGDTGKRSLRVHREADDSDDGLLDGNDDEERGFVSDLKIKAWLAKGKNPKDIYKKLGLEGLGRNAYKLKNYLKYIKFSKLWNKNQ